MEGRTTPTTYSDETIFDTYAVELAHMENDDWADIADKLFPLNHSRISVIWNSDLPQIK